MQKDFQPFNWVVLGKFFSTTANFDFFFALKKVSINIVSKYK